MEANLCQALPFMRILWRSESRTFAVIAHRHLFYLFKITNLPPTSRLSGRQDSK
jgi:hypothetical protein